MRLENRAGVRLEVPRLNFSWLTTMPGVLHEPQASQITAFVHPHVRKLAVEPLEDRRLLTITVSTLSDVVDGNITPGNYSLREAIANAPANEIINFSVTGTIQLTNVGHAGELAIDKSLTIQGPGADLLTIRAFDQTPDAKNGDGSRVFNIDDGITANMLNVSISGLTLTGGDSNQSGARFCRSRTSFSPTARSAAIRAALVWIHTPQAAASLALAT